MKSIAILKNTLTASLILLCFLSMTEVNAQSLPVWHRDINASPDTAAMLPVRTATDAANHVYVLSTYDKSAPGVDVSKIYLKKYDATGSLLWTMIYDSSATPDSRGLDMVVDDAGNCYIGGYYVVATNYLPLLLKVSPAGNLLWLRDSTTTFNTGYFDQMILKNDKLYLKASVGVAVFDLNGIEIWSQGESPEWMAVDNAGQIIISGYRATWLNLFRYDSTGIQNISDSALQARRIATDADNSFYLLTDYPQYELSKYDSSGNFVWNTTNLPYPPPSFGDISLDVLVDYNNDVIVTGLSDTMVKFTSSGNMIWKKSMHGMDLYFTSPKITYSNVIIIAGSSYDSSQYDMVVATFDLNGNRNWSGYYDGNTGLQEYTVDMAIDNSGVYVIENTSQYTQLAKFANPFFANVNYHMVCVDSVWYEPGNPQLVNVRVFNGDLNSLNYPSVRAISPVTGDTIINPSNYVTFFAHPGNSYTTYQDTITVAGITDFSSYPFFICEGFGDTIARINWCNVTAINETIKNEVSIYPNPAHDQLIIKNNSSGNKNYTAEIFSVTGVKVLEKKLKPEPVNRIDLSGLTNGIYFIRLFNGNNYQQFKLVKI